MSAAVSMRLEGSAAAIGALVGLKQALQNRILRRAVLDSTKPVYDAMRANVPVDTSTEKKSIGRKVVVYRGSNVVVGLVGPRTKMGREVVPRGRKKSVRRVPTKYAHLIERRSPFIAPAWQSTKAAAEALLVERVLAEVEKRS